jgi:AcrR family transcriptional regulator
MTRLTETLARRAVERTYADRQAEYTEEMQRIMEATYEYIELTGSLEPSLRDILDHGGLSTQGFYRYFRSKDELMLVLLDDGRRRLVEYLDRRMRAATTPVARVRAWIEGVLAQASNSRSAARTRPFVANEDRLAELFPDEQRESIDLVVGLLADALSDPSSAPASTGDAQPNAEAVYRLVFGMLHSHLILRTRPSPSEVEHAVRFCLRGCGLAEEW